jgi:hypothetical protein
MRAEPHPTYVSAAWAKKHPNEYSANAATGFETILNIMDAEISGEQTWGLTVDENAPGYVKGVTKTLNWIGSTWGRAVDGAWQATDAAFNFANFLIDAGNGRDKELIQAMMDLLGTTTTVITAPVKASMAVVLANLYSGMLIKFGYAAPKPAAAANRSSGNSEQALTGDQIAERNTAEATSQTTPNLQKDEPGVVGDFTATPAYNEMQR